MDQFIGFAVIVVVTLLVVSVLLQSRGSAGSGLFGGGFTSYRTRRGVEKTLFQLTIVLAVVFVILAFLNALDFTIG